MEDAGRVTGQLERPRQLLELAAATEFHFPHLRQVQARYDEHELGYHRTYLLQMVTLWMHF